MKVKIELTQPHIFSGVEFPKGAIVIVDEKVYDELVKQNKAKKL